MSNTTGMRVLFSGHATSRVVCSAVLHALDSACDGGVLAHAQRGSSGEKVAGPSTRKRQASRKRSSNRRGRAGPAVIEPTGDGGVFPVGI